MTPPSGGFAPSRGEVWKVRLDRPASQGGQAQGHEQANERPFLVLSDDEFNKSSQLIIGVPITTKLKRLLVGTHIQIPLREGGLTEQSYAMPEQIRTLTHDRLITHCGVLTPQTVNKVLDKIKALLHIDVIV